MNLLIRTFLCSLAVLLFFSCGKAPDSPKGCVTSFIIAVEQHDMSRAWGLLSTEAQKYYNGLGEKQRRSGKGAFEREINTIKSFFNAGRHYKFRTDSTNTNNVKLEVIGGRDFFIETIDESGYKIKDENSVKNILSVIAEKIEKEEHY